MSKVNENLNNLSEKEQHLLAIRHSAEHVLTMAMRTFFPRMKMAMGPATSDGFYFDVDLEDQKITEDDFSKLEREMYRIINKKLPIEGEEISVKEARKLFEGNEYKQEWLDEIEAKGEKVTIYWIGKGNKDEFVDLCSGPHVTNTSEIGTVKLLSLAGAYWRGDEKNKMLTRIYGTAFETKEELQDYLHMLEEARKRDHRKLGQELGLFLIDEEIGKGLPLWLPKGATLRKTLMDFALNTYLERGYKQVATPHIGSQSLWETSGHWFFYKDSLYQPFGIEDEQYLLKPMNCPFHIKMYQSQSHSYRDLPVRYTEMGTVYRYEKTGELSGLTRVRGFTQDDAHIFCRPDQLHEELVNTIKLIKFIWGTLGLTDFEVSLSVGDSEKREKYLGDEEHWKLAEDALEKALIEEKVPYKRYPGEAAFYGPKIDFLFSDSLGRKWQCSTVQVDFNMPFKFKMEYIDQEGKKVQPIMLHRALLGSIERSLAILIEHYAGAFPLWLSPIQVVVIPISEKFTKYGEKIVGQLTEIGARVELDSREESMQKRIRSAEKQKIPYMLVVGEKEEQSSTVAVRQRGRKDLGGMGIDTFKQRINKEIESKENW
ncbi:MAG: threonine--tRNA ligase [Patescibacteria group bacterium]|jgi:threonyl-tRNA synthetase